MSAVDIQNLQFTYPRSNNTVLEIERFQLDPGERVFLKGASGSGKSTLLGVIAGVLTSQAGQVSVLDQRIDEMSPARRDTFRANQLGVIFQMFNLLPYLPVGANVTLPCQFAPARARFVADHGGAQTEGQRLLSRLGLDGPSFWQKPTHALSVGQQQRVAAARALIGRPGLVLADEPTSALDSDSRDAFITLLNDECAANGSALIFVSHDGGLAHHFDRALDLSEINAAPSEGQL